LNNQTENELQELREDIEIYLSKILRFFSAVAMIMLPFLILIYLFYIFGDPVEDYTNGKGMYISMIICVSVILLRLLLKKIWFNKPWHN